MIRRTAFLVAALPAILAAAPGYWVYFGTYTNGASKGIYVSRFDPKTGSLSPAEVAGEIANPSWVALHPNQRVLYSVTETAQSSIAAFAIDAKSGKLTKLNEVPAAGSSACHLAIDRAGKTIAVANYGTGSVATFALEADGRLGKRVSFFEHKGSSADAKRQQGPHAHAVVFSRDGRFLIVPDLGLDKYLVYKFDAATGAISPNEPVGAGVKGGLGPRHFAFHPKGAMAFGLNEMGSSVTSFRYDAKAGALAEIATHPNLPADFKGTSNSAEIDVSNDGKFVYASNRGADTITVYRAAADGKLSIVEQVPTQGRTPRGFRIDPTGGWVIVGNQNTGNVAVFKRDKQSGKLTLTGTPLAVPAPVAIEFLAVK